MVTSKITYRSGYKYVLHEEYYIPLPLRGYNAVSPYFQLNSYGDLFVNKGYAWDGASGPAIDTKDFMRASLIHDVLCQMISEKLLPEKEQPLVDRIMRDICIADGMPRIRAYWAWAAVRLYFKTGHKVRTNPPQIAP